MTNTPSSKISALCEGGLEGNLALDLEIGDRFKKTLSCGDSAARRIARGEAASFRGQTTIRLFH